MRFTASVQTSESATLLGQLSQRPPFSSAAPTQAMWSFSEVPVPTDWLAAITSAKGDARLRWASSHTSLGFRPGSDLVIVSETITQPDPEDAVARIAGPSSFVCGLGSIFFEEWIAADYERWAFSRGHIDHGWGCVFRGAGHDHLVSRRWLDFGPWRVLRRPDDTTFVQFHDLAITDPALAYDVAKIGHERMGVSHTGGFIQQIYDWMLNDVRGPYVPDERKLEVLIHPNDELPQLRMTNAAALRRHCRLHPDQPQPVDRVAFVFFSDDHARAHLHELRLRDLECWSHSSRGLHRLDLDYHPTPSPPAWVTALEAREAATRGAP